VVHRKTVILRTTKVKGVSPNSHKTSSLPSIGRVMTSQTGGGSHHIIKRENSKNGMEPERSGLLDWTNPLELRTHIAAGRRRKRGCPVIRAP
jgi:hypothetical protein